MSVKTYSDAPYYDDYDPKKGYVQVLAKAGNYAQSREFTQIGTAFRDQIGNLGDAILNNGQIITGCELIIQDNNSTGGKTVSIQPGKIYISGMVREIYEPIYVDITGSGEERIGFIVDEYVVTAADDESLRNPAIGTEGYMQEGASRVKQEVKLTVNNDEAVNVYRLIDGSLYQEAPVVDNNLSTINSILARRTYETSGNFKVSGLKIFDKEAESEDDFSIYVDAGVAYIEGYDVRINNMVEIPLEIPRDTRLVRSEPQTYYASSGSVGFNNNPVKLESGGGVIEVSSIVEYLSDGGNNYATISRLQHADLDSLPLDMTDSVNYIHRVWDSSNEYVRERDYKLVGNRISWDVLAEGHIEPRSGSSYNVKFDYVRDNKLGEDYIIEEEGGTRVEFINSNRKPKDGTNVTLEYEYYLSRMDAICLDKDGDLSVLKGVSDVSSKCIAPANNDRGSLTLGTVLCYANGTQKSIKNKNVNRLTQSELLILKDRIDSVEYNQAQKDLDNEAKEGEDATLLKGIFTDGFLGLTKCDFDYVDSGETTPAFTCSIDLDTNEITVPYEEYSVTPLIQDSTVGIKGRVISAPYREVVVLSQPKATTKFLVNPYSVYGGLALCSISPSVDNWIDTKKITVEREGKTVNASGILLKRWWCHLKESWAQTERQKWIDLFGTDQLRPANRKNQNQTVTWKESSSSTVDSAITYMREITITVTGSNFTPNEDNIACYFNGKRVSITNKSISGTGVDTVRANSSGKFSFKFKIPKNTPCGSVEVKTEGPVSTATTTFTAKGTNRTITTTVLTNKAIVRSYDPLAQTFQFEKDTILGAMDLYFARKSKSGSSENKRSAVVQIRNVVNGYPGNICYEEVEITPGEINANSDRPVVTHIEFNQPVYCEAFTQYCFVIMSDVDDYQVWQATMGERDVVSGTPVTIQPMVAGVMFSSSNGLTWTAHQSSDLTFKLYALEYVGDGEIVYESVSSEEFNEFVLLTEEEDRKNDGIEWFYKTQDMTNYDTLETYIEKEMQKEIGRTVDLKCKIHCSPSTSPMIASDCANLILMKHLTEGDYISRTAFFDNPFDTIKVSIECALPTGCSMRVYYGIPNDRGVTWVEMQQDVNNPEYPVSTEFKKRTYLVENLNNATSFKVRVHLETDNPLNRPRARKLMCILRNENPD